MRALRPVPGRAGAVRRRAEMPLRRAPAAAPRVRAMAGGGTVTVVYRTQWQACELHYSDAAGACARRRIGALGGSRCRAAA
jgi:hypothetical protein